MIRRILHILTYGSDPRVIKKEKKSDKITLDLLYFNRNKVEAPTNILSNGVIENFRKISYFSSAFFLRMKTIRFIVFIVWNFENPRFLYEYRW